MNLRPGDIFAVRNTGKSSTLICKVNRFWSADNEARYSHTGVILSADGDTFEARRRAGVYHLRDFEGMDIIIGRPKELTSHVFGLHMPKIVDEFDGDLYPWWRIGLHLMWPLAKYVGNGDHLVCSELTGLVMTRCNIFSNYTGLTPDHIADRIEHWRTIELIYKGAYHV